MINDLSAHATRARIAVLRGTLSFMQNWAGNYEYKASRIETPNDADALAALVAATPRVRALGTRHCFNDIADMPGGLLISTANLTGIGPIRIVDGTPTVTVESGVTYTDLAPALHAAGYALANLASLPHITVSGATATATHGSGVGNGCLSTSVSGLEFVTADGSRRTLRRGDADFGGAVVHLGALGIVTKVTLDLVPTFEIAQHVYRRVPMAAVADHYDAILASAYSVSIFTNWQTDVFEQVWMKCRPGDAHFDLTTLGGTPATVAVHPIENVPGAAPFATPDTDNATIQLGVPGPWHERLPHFKAGCTPSSGEEIQSEFFVPLEQAKAAIHAIAALRDSIRPLIQVSEMRAVAADDLWMSPFYQRAGFGIHFTWRRDTAGVLALLPKIEAALAPLDVLPHWGKVFTIDRPAGRYSKAEAFAALCQRYDPAGKFRNPFIERISL